MAQVLEFKLPDLGEGLTEAEIVRWLVQVGDVVAVDQPVVEVETAKAMVEVPCPYGGVVTARFGEEGAELPVGAPLLTVAVGAGSSGAGVPGRANGRVRAAEPVDGPVPVISPLVRRLARENDLDLRELTGSGPDGLILRADVEYALRAAAAQGGRAVREAGAHPDGTVREQALAATAGATATGTTGSAGSAVPPGDVRIPLKGVRGAVADKLARSRREIPDATCWVDADATELMRARAAMNAASGPKISLVALLARICTAALARFPELNSTVDTQAREIVRFDHVHLGFAAQTDRGLVVPVVRDAHARDAEALTSEFARLTEAARAGRLTPGELTGGTFTLNNYGVFGVDGSTPIVNHPEAAMLGVGRIVPKPWVHEGELAVRQVVQLSLTFDHRVCDGGTAGGFLRYVADCVEQPAVLLRTL
ncbi:dihydrolipoamide acetyltransferase family protein [Streptomyces sp. CRB46]|uniref:dihydrolipoamide acetyltransferase family protein n=1 Tax=Streptomyces sp. CRB46 TaxID=2682613 RepID=UPI0018F593B1|nr:dihydrolipoamide acetyltransferase family protein [Streptomyces sp. CRB46]